MWFICDAVFILQPLSEKLLVVFLNISIHAISFKIIDNILIAGPSNTLKGVFDVIPVGTESWIINWTTGNMTVNSVSEDLDARDVSCWSGVCYQRKVILARGRES